MRRIALVSVVLLFAMNSAASAASRLPAHPREPWTPGDIVLIVPAGNPLARAAPGVAITDRGALGATLARLALVPMEHLRTATPPTSRRIEVLRLRSGLAGFDPVAAAAALRALPGVLGASPNIHFQLHVVPNDPFLGHQWYLNNSAASIHAQQGWARETGQPGQLIAILDTGVDTGHEDLAAKIWTNPAEIPNNGIDDDGNGFVDDVHGWDFGDGDNDPNPGPIIDAASGIDVGWHGTFVAGIAAAASDNATGIAGIAWGCRILPLKVADSTGAITLAAIANAFDYAIARHAAVINMSFGATDPSAASAFQPLVNEAFNAGIVCVASAGNDGTDALNYPAACDSVLSVASTNESNLRSTFSNWGPGVDLCAPGESMWSSIASNYVYDDFSLVFFEYLWGYNGVDPYMANDGTSFSAPVVSGAVALVRSHYPSLSVTQVMQQLIVTGDVKAYDNPIGPKLNLDRLLASALAVETQPTAHPALELKLAPNPASRAALLRFSVPATGPVRLAIYDAGGREMRRLMDDATPGSGGVEWDLHDSNGRRVPAGLYFARIETAAGRATRRLVVLP